MSNEMFPLLPGLEWNGRWTPGFKTRIQTAVSGKEYRSAMMASPVYRVSLSYEFLRAGAEAELQTLVGFFLARRGSYDNFLYRHPTDNAVTNQVIGTGDGTAPQFRLQRSFGSEFSEIVTNPLVVSAVTVNNQPVASGLWTLLAGGVVNLTSAPPNGAVVRASFSYLYRARFAADECEFQEFMQALWSAKKVDLVACLGSKV